MLKTKSKCFPLNRLKVISDKLNFDIKIKLNISVLFNCKGLHSQSVTQITQEK